MTTYTIFTDRIECSSRFSNVKFSTKTHFEDVLSMMSDDFYQVYSITKSERYLYISRMLVNLYNMVHDRPFLDFQQIVNIVRNMLSIERRRNYSKFRIIFVNEI